MEEFIKQIVLFIQDFVATNNIVLSLFVGSFAVIIESIIPALPLSVFIAINNIAFGNIIGFLVSWISTIIGCTISFYLCRKARKKVKNKFKDDGKIIGFINKIDHIKFSSLFLILAMPFTPAFSVNIAAGVSKMHYKKYLAALLLSKVFIVYFWGYIGSNIIYNLTNVALMVKMGIIIITLFIISRIIAKEYNL